MDFWMALDEVILYDLIEEGRPFSSISQPSILPTSIVTMVKATSATLSVRIQEAHKNT